MRLKAGYIILMMHLLLATLSLSYVPLFFKSQGYSLFHLILLFMLSTLGAVLFIPLIKTFSVRRFFLLSMGSYALTNLTLAFASSRYSFWLYPFFFSLNIVFFWINLNYFFFRSSTANTNGVDSSLYMASAGLLSIFIPPLGALIINYGNYSWLFGITAVLYLIPAYYIYRHIPDQKSTAGFMEPLKAFKGLKTITLAEGALGFFGGAIIPVYTILFFPEEISFGLFLSYIGFLGLVMALVVSYRSDVSHQRMKYLFPLFILMAASIFVFAGISSIMGWILAVGIFSILNCISSPLRLAVSMDVKKVDLGFWKMREFFLNVGRAVTLGISALFFYYKLFWPVFVLFGVMALAYPFLIKYKFKEMR